MKRQLRPDQQAALEAVRDSLRGGVKRIVVMAPTGWGKTIFAAQIVERALARKNRVTFVVSSISLIDQTIQRFYDEGIHDIGVIQSDHPMSDPSKPVQIASVQTLDSRSIMPDSTVNIFDECHVLYKAHKAWITERPEATFIGLSATPYAKRLGNYFETMLTAMTTREAIAAGILTPGRYFSHVHPDLKNKLKKVKRVISAETGERDYHRGEVSGLMRDNEISADVVDTWRKRWGRGKTLIFAVDLAHAIDLHARFRAEGVKAAYQDASTKRNGFWTTGSEWVDGRADIARKFESGEVDVVVSVGTLTTGVDWDVRYIGMGRPTQSETLYKQIIGRGLRTADQKDYCIVADHGGVCQELGFAEDIEYDHLHTADRPEPQRTTRVLKPKVCLACGVLRVPGLMACHNCGFQPTPTNMVFENDTELEYVDRATRPKGSKRIWGEAEKMQFMGELKSFARDKGYKPGWAIHKYEERFKEQASFEIKHAISMQPSPATISWIRSTQIRWAKSKANPRNGNISPTLYEHMPVTRLPPGVAQGIKP